MRAWPLLTGVALLAGAGCNSEPAPEIGSNKEAEAVVGERANDPAMAEREARRNAAIAGDAAGRTGRSRPNRG